MPHLPGQPATNKDRKFPPEVLSTEEVAALIAGCSHKAPTGIRNRALIWLLYRSGLRVSEALDLRPADVDLARHSLRVLHGKGDKATTRGFHPTATDALARALDNGAVLLGVCAGYQLLGHRFRTTDGRDLPGFGLLDVDTVPGEGMPRAVGEISVEPDPALGLPTLTGFENHGGRTHLGAGAQPLGRVLTGVGNTGVDGTEGAYAGKVLGTYLHGPVLVRNPALADLLLTWATGPLAPIDEADEEWAARLRAEGALPPPRKKSRRR